jgi:hypothetical protein
MDPIHPILPQKVNIPPVAESPRIGRIDRRNPKEDKREQRERPEAKHPGHEFIDELDAADMVGGEGPGPHIDITA